MAIGDKALAALSFGALLLAFSALYLLGNSWIAEREPDLGVQLPSGAPGRLLSVRGHIVHIVERGGGPAVLLVPGTAESTFDWEPVLERLARHRDAG